MATLVERCAGLDVHKDSVTACVRVADGHGGRHAETRSFSTTTAGLVLLVGVAGAGSREPVRRHWPVSGRSRRSWAGMWRGP